MTTEEFGAEDIMFTPGSIVSCVTCFDQNLSGEVVAFDYERKVLVIKTPSTVNNNTSSATVPSGTAGESAVAITSSNNNYDVHLLNLNLVGDVKIEEEGKIERSLESPPNININRLRERVDEAVRERRAVAKAHQAGITEDGIRLYLSLIKTIGHDNVALDGRNIVVNHCVIGFPYQNDSCSFSPKSHLKSDKALAYVQQLVSSFWTKNRTSASTSNQSTTTTANHATCNSSFDAGQFTGASSRSSPEKTTGQKQQQSPTQISQPTVASIVVAGIAARHQQHHPQQHPGGQQQQGGKGGGNQPNGSKGGGKGPGGGQGSGQGGKKQQPRQNNNGS